MMFKKLRKRMLLLNLSILTILLLAVFGTLYLSTYSNVQSRIDQELTKLINFNFFNDIVTSTTDNFRPDRTVSFITLLDENYAVIDSDAQFGVDQEFLSEAVNEATKNSGKFELDGYVWAYRTKEVDGGTVIAFTDVTSEQVLLNTLLIRFLVIFVISFGITALVSNFITKRSIRPLKESFTKQRQFIADASHELKTPLTVINANVDVLLDKNVGQDEEKWIKYIQTEVERMNKLTHDLLYLANMSEIEKQNIVKTKLNVSDIMESVLLGVEALAFEKKITLDYDIEDNIYVFFNKEQFYQVIMILLDNAIKYTDKSGHITVKAHKKSTSVYITVENTGVGVKEEDLNHIFDRFYKSDKSREYKSNSFGLGLPIAKTIIDNHEGKIDVESIPNKRTIFTIKLKSK